MQTETLRRVFPRLEQHDGRGRSVECLTRAGEDFQLRPFHVAFDEIWRLESLSNQVIQLDLIAPDLARAPASAVRPVRQAGHRVIVGNEQHCGFLDVSERDVVKDAVSGLMRRQPK